MDTKLSRTLSLLFVLGATLSGLLACYPEQTPVKPTATQQVFIEPAPVEQTTVAPKPVDCAQMQESSLRSLEFGKLQAEPMQQWLEQTSPFREAEIEVSPDFDGGIGALIWKHSRVHYYAYFHNDNVPTNILISWHNRGPVFRPTGDDVIACFGQPELYQAVLDIDHDGEYIDLSLWYLEKGLIIYSDRKGIWEEGQFSPFNGSIMRMDLMSFVAPGTAEEMVRNVYRAADRRNVREEILKSLKPWPGTWEKIVVDSD